jgi:hypothetical protein
MLLIPATGKFCQSRVTNCGAPSGQEAAVDAAVLGLSVRDDGIRRWTVSGPCAGFKPNRAIVERRFRYIVFMGRWKLEDNTVEDLRDSSALEASARPPVILSFVL